MLLLMFLGRVKPTKSKVEDVEGGGWIAVKEQGGGEAIHITPSRLTLETWGNVLVRDQEQTSQGCS